jgi:hypothetical protein
VTYHSPADFLSGDGLPVGEGDEGSRAPKIGLFRLTADWSASSPPAAPLTLSELELRPSLSADRPKRGDDDRPTLARLGDDDRLDDRTTTEVVLDRVSGDEGDGGLESNGDEGDGGDDETEASAERCAGADEGPPALEGGGEEAPALVRRRAGEDMERDEKEAEPEGEEEGEEVRTADMSPSLLPAACLPSRSCECS